MTCAARLTLTLLAAAMPLAAQVPRDVPLGRAAATYPGEFSLLRSVRELSNGSVLVADPIDKVLLRIDPTLQRADTLGRQGRGPGEYAQPDGIWALAADSSLLVDLGNNRLTVVDPAGRLRSSEPIVSGGGPAGPPTIMLIGGVDGRGGLWYRGSPGGDSIGVFRYDRATKRSARIAMIGAPPMDRQERSEGNGRSVSMIPVPLGAQDGCPSRATSRSSSHIPPFSIDFRAGVPGCSSAIPFTPCASTTRERLRNAPGPRWRASSRQ